MFALLLALVVWELQYKTSRILAEQDNTLYGTSLVPAKIYSDTEDGLTSKITAAVSASISPLRIASPPHSFLAAGHDRGAEWCEIFRPFASIDIPQEHPDLTGFCIRPPPLS